MRTTLISVAALALLCAGPVVAAEADTFITLGTQGGPISNAERSQPANALIVGDGVYLVDAGDGAAEQLAKAGIPLQALKAVFISHLHFDHTGGLFAILGLRYQTNAPGKLRIYGPPGTRETVAGLLAAMQPGAEAGYGLPGAEVVPPADLVDVREIRDSAEVEIDGFTVRAAENTHYSFAPGSELGERFDSLAFRFDLADRSIVYTGDTGPSDKVTVLAMGADLLVSEMIDVARTVDAVRRANPHMPDRLLQEMTRHLGAHHLTAADVGRMAARADVGRVVLTHFVAGNDGHAPTAPYIETIGQYYAGPAEVADDLDRF